MRFNHVHDAILLLITSVSQSMNMWRLIMFHFSSLDTNCLCDVTPVPSSTLPVGNSHAVVVFLQQPFYSVVTFHPSSHVGAILQFPASSSLSAEDWFQWFLFLLIISNRSERRTWIHAHPTTRNSSRNSLCQDFTDRWVAASLQHIEYV